MIIGINYYLSSADRCDVISEMIHISVDLTNRAKEMLNSALLMHPVAGPTKPNNGTVNYEKFSVGNWWSGSMGFSWRFVCKGWSPRLPYPCQVGVRSKY